MAKTDKVFGTACTLGLSEMINSTFEYLAIAFKSEWFETDKFGDLNKTYLDSFDLVVVGGILYLWEHASNNDKIALASTDTPIISSAHIGIFPDLKNITGFVTNKEPYEAWSSSVLPFKDTLIQYHTDILDGYSSEQWIVLIDGIVTPNATIIATAHRGNKTYPYLVKIGKNYYINTYTYPGVSIRHEISIILDSIFDLYPDAYFDNIKHYSLRRILNTLLIPATVLTANFLFYNPLKIQIEKNRKLRLQLSINGARMMILSSTLLLLIALLLFFLVITHFPQISIERYISIELLFTSVLLLIALASIILNSSCF
jgi:hypothetical protein